MSYMPITDVTVASYGRIKKLAMSLTPIHALIGPPGGGKSTFLAALGRAVHFAAGLWFPSAFPYQGRYETHLGYHDWTYTAYETSDGHYRDTIHPSNNDRALGTWVTRTQGKYGYLHDFPGNGGATLRLRLEHGAGIVALGTHSLADATLAVLDPARKVWFNDTALFPVTGLGLGSALYILREKNIDAFMGVQQAMRAAFPALKSIGVTIRQQGGGQATCFVVAFFDGVDTPVEAPALGSGFLTCLFYLVLEHCALPSLLIVHEPEAHLHPARVALVMDALRRTAVHTQVLIETHSPLVVNELDSHEVSVILPDPHAGSRAVRLCDTAAWENAQKVYCTGEYWVSYCDGIMEKNLMQETTEAADEPK